MDDVVGAGAMDPTFVDQIVAEPGGKNVRRCFACGTCTASCPIREVTERYNPRRIIHMALLGLKQQVLSSDLIWICSTCYACHERCPQDVRITELMHAIKNIAVREGYIHPSVQTQGDLIRKHGRLDDITDFENQRRSDVGLPPIIERPEDYRRILSATGLDAELQLSEEGPD